MVQKFYFHDANASVSGSLPSSYRANTSGLTATQATGYNTYKTMTDSIGSSQVAVSSSSSAITTAQAKLFRSFVSPPLAAHSLNPFATLIFKTAGSESSTSANMQFSFGCCYVWRPSSGTLVGVYFDDLNTTTTLELGVGETAASWNNVGLTVNGVSILDGDVLIFELWSYALQTMAGAYTQTVYYDGTTENSTTSNAGYIDFGEDIPLLSAPPSTTFEGWGVPV